MPLPRAKSKRVLGGRSFSSDIKSVREARTSCAGSPARRGLTLAVRFVLIPAISPGSCGVKMLESKSYPLFRKLPQGRTIDARYNHPQNASRTGKTLRTRRPESSQK